MRPNFFLVGAPKCGTTALATWLGEHPRAFVSTPKEPHFFAEDLPRWREVRDLESYCRLFAAAPAGAAAVGEASVMYLASAVALDRIRAFARDARIVAMVRSPLELVPSLHAQLLYTLDEDEADLGRAWRLQAERRSGRRLPATCREPLLLQYREVALLGAQVERLLDRFPRRQVQVVVHDDLRTDPGRVYRDTLAFLGLDDDGRTSFAALNPRRPELRRRWLALLVGRPPWPLPALHRALRAATRGRGTGLGRPLMVAAERLRRLAEGEVVRRAPDPALRAEMGAAFAGDVALLGRLLGRDLGHWLAA
jgi:hypothetical protein